MDQTSATDSKTFAGHLDGLSGTGAHGWAVDSDGAPCAVRLVVNGTSLQPAMADQPRPDLAEKGLSKGLGGWGISVAEALVDGENRIEAYFPDDRPLGNSPLLVPVSLKAIEAAGPVDYLGAVDWAQPPILIGWAASTRKVGAPVTVEIEGQSPVTVLSTGPRPDLVESGLTKRDGGWQIDIRDMLKPGTNLIHLRLPNGAALSGSPVRIEHGPTESVGTKAPPAEAEPTPAPSQTLSLAELDEVSLDDLIDAVVKGKIDMPAPPVPPAEPEAPSAPAATVVAEPRRAVAKPGFFGRLFGRS
jgi:hypothetical protein